LIVTLNILREVFNPQIRINKCTTTIKGDYHMNTIFLVIISLLAFISTNLDDIFLLTAFFARDDFLKRDVILGQYLGMMVLILISSTAYFFKFIIPDYLIGLLGFLPLIIGVKNLLYIPKNSKIYNEKSDDADKNHNSFKTPNDGNKRRFKLLKVFSVTFASGGDNIGVYAPLFVGWGYLEILVVVLVFLIMTGIWCLMGIKMVDNRIIGKRIEKYGHLILPLVLIGIGIMIIIKGFL
jgi:cadmium resistance protein CadD (predicted permease)